jgi:hypothetical protein
MPQIKNTCWSEYFVGKKYQSSARTPPRRSREGALLSGINMLTRLKGVAGTDLKG